MILIPHAPWGDGRIGDFYPKDADAQRSERKQSDSSNLLSWVEAPFAIKAGEKGVSLKKVH